MNTERAQVGWGFGLWWVLASVVGLVVGFAVATAVAGVLLDAGGFVVVFCREGGSIRRNNRGCAGLAVAADRTEQPSPPQEAA